MKNKWLTIRFLAVLVGGFAVLGGCAMFGELETIRSGQQPIAGQTEIGPEWREITPPNPLQPVARIHKVSVRTPDIETFDPGDGSRTLLKFKNGESGRIEAVLIDDRGEPHELQIVGIGGAGGGVYLGIRHDLREGGEPPAKEPDFPPGQTFPKLRIRSDVPIQCDKIEWVPEIQK